MEAEEAAHYEAISKDRRRLIPVAGSSRQGSLAAAVAQCLSLGVMCTAAAYPSWVLVSGGGIQFVLGVAWAVHPKEPAPHSPLLGRAGGILMVSIAVCCVLAILSGCGALVLDFLGLRRGRVAAPLLHGLAALLAAGAAALCSCLFQLIRSRLRTEKELQPLGLSSTPGSSFFLSILACALATTATGLSCSASARVGSAAGLPAPGTARRRGRPSFKREGEGDNNTQHSRAEWQGETDFRKERVLALIQGETEPEMSGSLRFIYGETEPRTAGSVPTILRETEPGIAGSLPFSQGETEPQMENLPFRQSDTEPRMAGSLLFIRGETESPLEAGLPFIQGNTEPCMGESLPFIQPVSDCHSRPIPISLLQETDHPPP